MRLTYGVDCQWTNVMFRRHSSIFLGIFTIQTLQCLCLLFHLINSTSISTRNNSIASNGKKKKPIFSFLLCIFKKKIIKFHGTFRLFRDDSDSKRLLLITFMGVYLKSPKNKWFFFSKQMEISQIGCQSIAIVTFLREVESTVCYETEQRSKEWAERPKNERK